MAIPTGVVSTEELRIMLAQLDQGWRLSIVGDSPYDWRKEAVARYEITWESGSWIGFCKTL